MKDDILLFWIWRAGWEEFQFSKQVSNTKQWPPCLVWTNSLTLHVNLNINKSKLYDIYPRLIYSFNVSIYRTDTKQAEWIFILYVIVLSGNNLGASIYYNAQHCIFVRIWNVFWFHFKSNGLCQGCLHFLRKS